MLTWPGLPLARPPGCRRRAQQILEHNAPDSFEGSAPELCLLGASAGGLQLQAAAGGCCEGEGPDVRSPAEPAHGWLLGLRPQ